LNQDRRISGTAASLAGLEAALAGGDPQRIDLTLRRLLLAHAAVLSFGGIPLLYMGDELALRNDYGYAEDPEHAGDNRWVHRPVMPWDVADRRHEPGTLEHRIWHGLRHLVTVRSGLLALDASIDTQVLRLGHHAVLGWLRPQPRQPLVALHNVSDSSSGGRCTPCRWPAGWWTRSRGRSPTWGTARSSWRRTRQSGWSRPRANFARPPSLTSAIVIPRIAGLSRV
jgi:glycosidase